jgi:hypothetical protein
MKNSVQKNGLWALPTNWLLSKQAHTNLNKVISYTGIHPYISYPAKPNLSTCLSVYALPSRSQEFFWLKAAKQNKGFCKQKSNLTGYTSYFKNQKALVFLPKAIKDQAEDNNKIHLDKKKILSRSFVSAVGADKASQQNPIVATFTKKSMAYSLISTKRAPRIYKQRVLKSL